MFTADAIHQRIKQQPFVPLRIVTSSGERYEVHHPDLVMVGERDIQIGTAGKKNPAYYGQVSRVALLHVTDLQDLPVPASSGKNGPPAS
jgi:hypothetical protein